MEKKLILEQCEAVCLCLPALRPFPLSWTVPQACWCLCSHLWCPLPGAAEGFLMGRLAAPPGREPSGCLPFSLLRSSWHALGPAWLPGLALLQPCRHPVGWQTISALELGPCLTILLLSGVFVAWRPHWFFFFVLHVFFWREDFQVTPAERGQFLATELVSFRWEIWVGWFILCCFLREKHVYGQFKVIQNFRRRMGSERICCFELQSFCVSAPCQ